MLRHIDVPFRVVERGGLFSDQQQGGRKHFPARWWVSGPTGNARIYLCARKTAGAPPRMLKKLSLTLVAVLISLLACEGLVRLVGAAPKIYAIRKGRFQLSHNPRIGYEPAPLVYSGDELSFYDYRGSSNRLGYRDRDHELAKPPGVYRIVVLGDSIAAGLRVDRTEDIFPEVLERLLRQRGLNAEVVNLSVSGYNTQQEVETLMERGLG